MSALISYVAQMPITAFVGTVPTRDQTYFRDTAGLFVGLEYSIATLLDRASGSARRHHDFHFRPATDWVQGTVISPSAGL